MSLVVYNTLGRKKEPFVPVSPPHVSIYLCGPTVYDLLHIGNFRGVIFFNIVRNWLDHLGYNVKFVLNFTDIDDKIIDRAHESNQDPLALSEHFIQEYKRDVARLAITPHDVNPKCTDHIEDMISFIDNLIQKEAAYEVEGSVFYAINSFKDYGKLSGKNLDDLQAGHRVDPDPRKRNPLDFILWKPAKPGEPSWESPWGAGRPGWHIECSAMNHSIHGPAIDIHGGGIDLIFPHHENEIAQSEAMTGTCFSKYWMHNNFIRFGKDKMSKSLGNVVKARDYMNDTHPEILKFLMLSVHYRSELTVDDSQTQQTIGRLTRIYKALNQAHSLALESAPQNIDFNKTLETASETITAALNDDFNTPVFFATIFEVVREFNNLCTKLKAKNPELKAAAYLFKNWCVEHGKILSLFQEEPAPFLDHCNIILVKINNIDTTLVESKISERNQARTDKDFAAADAIRNELLKSGVALHDHPTGTSWEVVISS